MEFYNSSDPHITMLNYRLAEADRQLRQELEESFSRQAGPLIEMYGPEMDEAIQFARHALTRAMIEALGEIKPKQSDPINWHKEGF